MSKSMRLAVLLGWAAVAACESEPPAEPASEPGETAAEKAQVAAPDAPIAAGEQVPKRAAGEDPQGGPDPAQAGGLDAALSRLAQRYAGGWLAASASFETELAEGERRDYQLVLGSVHCYRVLGAGSDSLEDVDLRLFDPAGVQVQQDEGEDRFPVLGLSYPVCPPSPGAYRLQAVAVKGAGTLKVQAFHGT